MRHADQVAAELALVQCGAFGAWQLKAAGVPDDARDQRVGSGRWERPHPGVYLLPGAPPCFEQRLWVARLAVGPQATVTHEAAAQLLGIPDVVRGLVTLSVPHSGWHRIPGAVVHQIGDHLPEHVIDVAGLPTTTVARTIVDLAAGVHPARLIRIVEDSKHAGLTTYVEIGACLTAIARQGKRGMRKLARALDELTKETVLTQSQLEHALFSLLRRFEVEAPIPQYPHPGRQFVRGCTDGGYPDGKLILEVDSRAWHTRIRDLKRDHERDNEAAREGWDTLRLYYEDIIRAPEQTAETVRTVLAQRRRLLSANLTQ